MQTVISTTRAALMLPAILAIGAVGEVFIYLSPVLLGSVVETFSLREGTAGLIIALEIGASSISAVFISSVIHRFQVRITGFACIIVVIACDYASSFVQSIELFIIMRVLAAVGAGALFALANILAANTHRPEKTFALMGIAVILAATLGFIMLTHAIENYGPQSAFAALALMSCIALPFMFGVPVSLDRPATTGFRVSGNALRSMAIAILVSVFLLFVGQNALWVYVERIGTGQGFELATISTIMILNGFLSLLGPFAAHQLSTRIGRSVPTAGAMIVQIIMINTLVLHLGIWNYAVSLITLSISYVFVIPYVRGMMAALDPSGRLVGSSTALVSIGAATGPAFGGIILNMGGTYTTIAVLSSALFIVSLASMLPVARWADAREDTDQ